MAIWQYGNHMSFLQIQQLKEELAKAKASAAEEVSEDKQLAQCKMQQLRIQVNVFSLSTTSQPARPNPPPDYLDAASSAHTGTELIASSR
jgi:hypothetical protein